MFNGRIQGLGPRYCPSIEDKIERFSSKDRHQLFIEPEGKKTIEIYLNGFSTSLPEKTQIEALRKIEGLENVKMFRAGYAIEYDYFPPTQLKHTLETKIIKNLFFSGQINGTTGYEEAACQGLIAGINAHCNIENKNSFILERSDAYIGVLIDDLITKGTDEPYRMFTSRAEYRLLLRQDNADERLTKIGYKIGLASKERLKKLEKVLGQSTELLKFIKKLSIEPNIVNEMLVEKNSSPLKQKLKMNSLIARPHITIKDLMIVNELRNYLKDNNISQEAIEKVEIEIKYGGYLNKEKKSVEKFKKFENMKLDVNFDYSKLHSISTEGRKT